MTRVCTVCHTSYEARSDSRTCSARCRQRRRRVGHYVITAEDRAAMDRAAELVPVPVPPLTPEQIRAHILATARRD